MIYHNKIVEAIFLIIRYVKQRNAGIKSIKQTQAPIMYLNAYILWSVLHCTDFDKEFLKAFPAII